MSNQSGINTRQVQYRHRLSYIRKRLAYSSSSAIPAAPMRASMFAAGLCGSEHRTGWPALPRLRSSCALQAFVSKAHRRRRLTDAMRSPCGHHFPALLKPILTRIGRPCLVFLRMRQGNLAQIISKARRKRPSFESAPEAMRHHRAAFSVTPARRLMRRKIIERHAAN
jgi:hypothetical protein